MNQDEIKTLRSHLQGMKGREDDIQEKIGDLMAQMRVMESERISFEILFNGMIEVNNP
jgi:cell division protein FtsL